MAQGDAQVTIPNGPAPTTKEVVGLTPIVPKAVNATFDGTGAGGAFLPCLVITGKEGLEVARIPAPQVAAGASAEVSWFPRVAAPARAAGGDYVLIGQQGVDASGAITFPVIPQNFEHLVLELSIQTVNVPKAIAYLKWGTVTYFASNHLFFGNGSSTIHRAVDTLGQFGMAFNQGVLDGVGASVRTWTIPTDTEPGDYAAITCKIPYYSRSDRNKYVIWQGSVFRNIFTDYIAGSGSVGVDGAQDPIADLTIYATDGLVTTEFLTGDSTASLYGIT